MQNRTIDERLQILNDYIQRTIDALNVTRQVAVQTLGSPMMQMGLSHTPLGWQQSWQQPQFVQTPQGIVQVNPHFAPVHPMGQVGVQYGYGLQHSGFVPNYGYGVQQTPFVQQSPFVQAPFVAQTPFVHQPQFVPQFVPSYGYGLQHSSFVPQWSNVTPWTNIPVGFVPVGVPQVVPQVHNRDLGLQNAPVNVAQTQI